MRTKGEYKAQRRNLPPKGPTGIGRTISETVTVRVPDRTISDELIHGTYANSVDSLNSGTEVVLDFTLVYPAIWKKETTADDLQRVLKNDVVARIMMPSDRWDEFVISYVLSQPAIREFLTIELTSPKPDSSTLETEEVG